MEGETRLSIDTDAAPSTKSVNYRFFGFFFLVLGVAAGIWAATGVIRHRTA